MKLYFLVFASMILSSCVKPVDLDTKETKLLFNQISILKRDMLPYKRKFLVIDSVIYNDQFILRICKESLMKDDIQYIKAQVASHIYIKWQQSVFDSLKVVDMKLIDSLSKPDPFIHTPSYIRLSKPYFSKKRDYCLLLYSYYCGNLCAESAVRLYRKVNGKWEFVESFGRMVS
ncbi:hypothetical protein SAMN05428975_6003 [Mucilaginibacter sp. OK268]|uniref:hypothetical protein n=1 Tax=Mucilaginibacter sp. OK268 TaxID=1881048 RepID=UPI0008810624|nr:hypothetical protein [Mucilaginibacter sp. OK268]SDQ01774.1 hypothetical protein SAMN05428975_6003 [Mucilaginibacter sp. OK268]